MATHEVTTRQISKKIEDVIPGNDDIDLAPWFESVYTPNWIEQIEAAYEQWDEDYWHDEENSNCEEDDDTNCTCPAPDKAKVAAGMVWVLIRDEYVSVTSIEVESSSQSVAVQIYFPDEDEIPSGLTKFHIDPGTKVKINEYEEVPTNQALREDEEGPLQPPKDFMKGLVVESSKGPDLSPTSFATRDLTWG
jgi:hypothetical protein